MRRPDVCQPGADFPPGWALVIACLISLLMWAVVGCLVWLAWPVSGWIVLGLLAGIVACNLPWMFRS